MKRVLAVIALTLFVTACGGPNMLPIAAPTANPVPELVETVLPPGYKYVSDYVTTRGGDTVWVVEVTEPSQELPFGKAAAFFGQFAGLVDTTDVAWLELSIVSSDFFLPYAYRVPSGPARAAARGEISEVDLMMQLHYN